MTRPATSVRPPFIFLLWFSYFSCLHGLQMSTAVASIVTSSDSGSTIDSEREPQVCTLNVAQKDILTETWKEIDDEEKKQTVGIMMFNRILEIAPAAIALFPKFRDVPADRREKDENYRKHAYTVVDAIGLAVSFLDDIDTLEGVLVDLGSTHAKYGIQPAHFEVVGEALIYTFRKQFEAAFTHDIEKTWIQFYGFVSYNMTKGLNEAYASQEE